MRSRAPRSTREGTHSSAATDGVAARTSAANSASVTSVSWPTPTTMGTGNAAMARTTASSLKAHRSSIEPPPRARMTTSAARPVGGVGPAAQAPQRRARCSPGRPGPAPGRRSRGPARRPAPGDDLAHVVEHGARQAGADADRPRPRGSGRLRLPSNRPSCVSCALSASNRSARSPKPAGWRVST